MITRRTVVRFVLALALSALSVGSYSVAAQEKADRFYIFGHVKSPGAYAVKPAMTVGDAVDVAGGISPRGGAAIEIVRIVDGKQQTTVVTFNDAVLPNDTIIVK